MSRHSDKISQENNAEKMEQHFQAGLERLDPEQCCKSLLHVERVVVYVLKKNFEK